MIVRILINIDLDVTNAESIPLFCGENSEAVSDVAPNVMRAFLFL